ncbi:hypothetical protein H2200_009023 [Cladophialophora chaetospira]|uniref:Uncharacterized protein n=1 Tax=Cladophialophora chaetospira TaxID=386627 RepID=A0AA38X3B0_9EURO|nr:hypothetical protein H2200_009023 [Cladophialophora chaetospira]
MAMFIGDREAAMYHHDALGKLIGLVGGLRNLLPFHQCLIVYLIVRIAMNTRTRTLLDPAEWNPTRMPVLEEENDSADILTTNSALSRPWKGIFVALKELALVERFSDRVADRYWTFLRRHAIRAEVTNMWCDFTEPIKATDPVPGISATPTSVHQSSLDVCICLAVQNYIILTSEQTTLAQHAVSTTQIFHIMLIRCLDKLEVDLEQLPQARDLLWVLGVGATVEVQVRSQLQRRSPWINCDLSELEVASFVLHFGSLAARMGFETYDEVASMFEKDYVYSPSVQEQVLRRSFHSAGGLGSGKSGERGTLWTFTRPIA